VPEEDSGQLFVVPVVMCAWIDARAKLHALWIKVDHKSGLLSNVLSALHGPLAWSHARQVHSATIRTAAMYELDPSDSYTSLHGVSDESLGP
jgi:hypothetical protein